MAVFLSHFLNSDTPGFGGAHEFKTSHRSQICCGRSANSLNIELSNHVGTHIDLPYHFDDKGKRLNHYEADNWIFNNPQLLDIPTQPGQLIDLEPLADQIHKNTDLLLLRTGFESKRAETVYWENNPGMSINSGHFLREKCPQVKALGFDFISLTAYQHRDIGREAHRAYLAEYKNLEPVLIIEDMQLSNWKSQLNLVIVSPLLISDADGSPVTVIGNE